MVLIALMVLSVLGTALLSMSVTNFKLRMMDKNSKTSFYLSEAGLEEAYAKIGKTIHEAIQEGNKAVKNQLNPFIENEREKEMADLQSDDSEFIQGKDGTGAVDEAALKTEMNKWFQDTYMQYINDGNESELSLEQRILNDYEKLDPSLADDYAKINVEDVDDFGSQYTIALLSEFEYKGVTRKIKAIYAIDVPDYGAPYYVMNEKSTMERNVLFMKALTTEKDMIVEDGNVTIEGDIYAYGTQPDDPSDADQYGGVVAGQGGKSGILTINGNVYTNSYVHTNADDSQMTINDGDVFCNSLVIQDGTTNCKIQVNDGVVNTFDDLELNGEFAVIDIDGSYYAFSEGLTAHNESSSIVINSDDIGLNSSINISGIEVANHQTDLNEQIEEQMGESNDIIGNDNYTEGTFLGGMVYINTADGTYQTGESVSIKGNYKAYTYYFGLADLEALAADNEGFSEEDYQYQQDNIEMGDYAPLVLADQFVSGGALEYQDKIRYIQIYNALNQTGKPAYDYSLNLGNNGIHLGNLIYSAGVWMNDEGNMEGRYIAGNFDISNRKGREYAFHINRMSDPLTDLGDTDALNSRLELEDWFDFDLAPKEIEDHDELVLINNNSEHTLILRGAGGSSVSGDKVIDASDLKGLIITKGDVVITGEVNYQGCIVAEGDIIFTGSGEKTITYSDRILEAFILPTIKTEGLENYFKSMGQPEISFLYQIEAGVDDTGSYIKFEDLVDTTWEKVD